MWRRPGCSISAFLPHLTFLWLLQLEMMFEGWNNSRHGCFSLPAPLTQQHINQQVSTFLPVCSLFPTMGMLFLLMCHIFPQVWFNSYCSQSPSRNELVNWRAVTELRDDKLHSAFLQLNKLQCFHTLWFICLFRLWLFSCRRAKEYLHLLLARK